MRGLLIAFAVTISTAASAYISGITIESSKASQMMVYVNGKLYNKAPGNFIHIKSLPGLFHIEVKVWNPADRRWYLLRKEILVEKGYDFQYKVSFDRRNHPEIKMVNRFPVYSKYFVKPDLYIRNPVS